VEDGRKTHPFYKDIDTESAYWWFPLFCLQPLLCLSCFAPQTFKLYGRYQKGKKECCHRLNDLLKPKRIGCTWPDTGGVTKLDSSFRDSIIFWDVGDEAVDEDKAHGHHHAGSSVAPDNSADDGGGALETNHQRVRI